MSRLGEILICGENLPFDRHLRASTVGVGKQLGIINGKLKRDHKAGQIGSYPREWSLHGKSERNSELKTYARPFWGKGCEGKVSHGEISRNI